MHQFATAAKILSIAVASACTVACNFGTSRSSSGQYSENQDLAQDIISSRPEDANLSPIQVDQDNYFEVASLSLKAILLTDTTASVLDRSAQVTRNNSSNFATASGVLIDIDPLDCEEGGTVKIDGEVTSGGGVNQPIDFQNTLFWQFTTAFDTCSQGGNLVSGDILVTFDMNLTELLNSSRYVFNSSMNVTDVLVVEAGLDPVVIDGTYSYSIRNFDGSNSTTRISTSDTTYYLGADTQTFDYTLEKTVNSETEAYSYTMSGRFSPDFLDSEYVEYETIQPFQGQGKAYPSSGKVAVFGESSTIYITAMPNDILFIEYDHNLDGEIDEDHYDVWDNLVLDVTQDIHIE